MSRATLPIEGFHQLMEGDFSNAGTASSELKNTLTRLGVPDDIVRRASVAAFEAEMNVIIHGVAGTFHYLVDETEVVLTITDMGPGIKDVELAMREGYSTAPDWVREMGWGAGMGLPNIKKNSDLLRIETAVGEGTTLYINISFREAVTKGEKTC